MFKVGERLRVGQLLVDWFRFWLKDEADTSPQRSDQYQRWEVLREQDAVDVPSR